MLRGIVRGCFSGCSLAAVICFVCRADACDWAACDLCLRVVCTVGCCCCDVALGRTSKCPNLNLGRRAFAKPSRWYLSALPTGCGGGIGWGGGHHQFNRCLKPLRVLVTCFRARVHLGAEDSAGAGREAGALTLFFFSFFSKRGRETGEGGVRGEER